MAVEHDELDVLGQGSMVIAPPPVGKWTRCTRAPEVSSARTLASVVGQAGRVHAGSPMPWGAFKQMSDGDLRALHRYLRTLPPAAGGPAPSNAESVLLAAEGVASRP